MVVVEGLLCFCLQCNSPANIIKTTLQGTMLPILLICQKGHSHIWHSLQLTENCMSEVNLFLAASLQQKYLFSNYENDVLGLLIFSSTAHFIKLKNLYFFQL